MAESGRPLGSLLVRIESADPRRLLASATVVAGVATAGSLYLSLGLGLVPCELCWYQRVLMYPLVVVLGVAAAEGRPGAWRTVLWRAPVVGLTVPNLSLVGFVIVTGLVAVAGLAGRRS